MVMTLFYEKVFKRGGYIICEFHFRIVMWGITEYLLWKGSVGSHLVQPPIYSALYFPGENTEAQRQEEPAQGNTAHRREICFHCSPALGFDYLPLHYPQHYELG